VLITQSTVDGHVKEVGPLTLVSPDNTCQRGSLCTSHSFAGPGARQDISHKLHKAKGFPGRGKTAPRIVAKENLGMRPEPPRERLCYGWIVERVRAGIVLQTPIPGTYGIEIGSICNEAKQWSIDVSLSMH
jgi:hypothetical protein